MDRETLSLIAAPFVGATMLALYLIIAAVPAVISFLVHKTLGRVSGVVSVVLWFAVMYFGAGPLWRYVVSSCDVGADCGREIWGALFLFYVLLGSWSIM